MNFSPKALWFLIDAVEYRIGWYEQQLQRDDLNDDELADLGNDHGYFQALLGSLKEEELKGREAARGSPRIG